MCDHRSRAKDVDGRGCATMEGGRGGNREAGHRRADDPERAMAAGGHGEQTGAATW
jgi:hypothetical protein